MITPEQETWLAHLSDTDSIKIFPANPEAHNIFKEIKKKIQSNLGENISVIHKGATSLDISGQGELDVYVPVEIEGFGVLVDAVQKIFGPPRSLYALDRARFVTSIKGIKIEIFVINQEGKGWTDSCKFEQYLKENPKALRVYEKLKEEGEGLSTQKYYRRKIEFINEILDKIK